MLIKRLVATTALSLVLAIPAAGFAANSSSNMPAATRIDSGKLLNADVDNSRGDRIGDTRAVHVDLEAACMRDLAQRRDFIGPIDGAGFRRLRQR